MSGAIERQRLELQGVTKYFGGVRVLDDVSLDVAPGELVSILGASGCGKSTLLRVVAGLETAEGSVLIGGEPMRGIAPKDRAVAFVFQSYALYPHMSVRQNIAAPLVMRALKPSDRIPLVGSLMPGSRDRRARIDERVRATVDLLQIQALLDRKPSQLSGGQRQRVALGRALIREPKLFLLDEPLANLDAALRHQTRSELRSLQQRLGTTTLFVTHDQTEAMALSDRVAVMFAGRIRQVGTPDELYREPVDIDVARFLSQPVLNALPAQSHRVGSVETEGATILIARARGGRGTLAFRPQNAALFEPGARVQQGLAVEVEHGEHAGPDAHIFVSTVHSREPCTVRVPSAELHRWRPGMEATLAIEPDAAWFFEGAGAGVPESWLAVPSLRIKA